MTANVLCDRHNSALSGLDTRMARLFARIMRVDSALSSNSARRAYLFNGNDIERWLLKACLGAIAGSAARMADGTLLQWEPPLRLLYILFGSASFAATRGLYVRGDEGATFRTDPGIGASVMSVQGEIAGVVVALNGVQFALSVIDVPPAEQRRGAINAESIYRPGELKFEHVNELASESIMLAWPDASYRTQVSMTWFPHAP